MLLPQSRNYLTVSADNQTVTTINRCILIAWLNSLLKYIFRSQHVCVNSKTQDLRTDCLHPLMHAGLFSKYFHQRSPEQKTKSCTFFWTKHFQPGPQCSYGVGTSPWIQNMHFLISYSIFVSKVLNSITCTGRPICF